MLFLHRPSGSADGNMGETYSLVIDDIMYSIHELDVEHCNGGNEKLLVMSHPFMISLYSPVYMKESQEIPLCKLNKSYQLPNCSQPIHLSHSGEWLYLMSDSCVPFKLSLVSGQIFDIEVGPAPISIMNRLSTLCRQGSTGEWARITNKITSALTKSVWSGESPLMASVVKNILVETEPRRIIASSHHDREIIVCEVKVNTNKLFKKYVEKNGEQSSKTMIKVFWKVPGNNAFSCSDI